MRSARLMTVLTAIVFNLAAGQAVGEGIENCSLAMRIGASGEHLFVPHPASLNLTAGITIEVWGLFEGAEANPALEIVKRGDNNRGYVLSVVPLGSPAPYINGGIFGKHSNTAPFTPPSNGEWHHYAWTYDGSVSKVYYDGELLQALPYAGSISSTSCGLYLGIGLNGDCTWNGATAEGWYDEVRIWNYARSATGILTDYATQLEGAEPGLVGYWNFNAADGGDLSGLGNRGTPSPGVTFESACDVPIQRSTWSMIKSTYIIGGRK